MLQRLAFIHMSDFMSSYIFGHSCFFSQDICQSDSVLTYESESENENIVNIHGFLLQESCLWPSTETL